jgi:hypothetical protein
MAAKSGPTEQVRYRFDIHTGLKPRYCPPWRILWTPTPFYTRRGRSDLDSPSGVLNATRRDRRLTAPGWV